MVLGRGEECPAALTPDFDFRASELLLEASGGGVGVTLSRGEDEFSLGRLFAAAVSRGGGWGRSLPWELVVELDVPLDRVDPDFEAVSVALLGLVVESAGMGASSNGLNLACSGSLESTMSVVEVELPNKLIFFARATREDRRRWRMEGCGRFESSSL